jgi:outer membrane cobalamin receptor
MAYGQFRQKPENEYLLFAPALQSEQSEHFILNFQYKKQRRILRVEAYLKNYDNLVKYARPLATSPDEYNNDGLGYAGGLDLFYRDRKTVDGLDFWFSYSLLDTRRDYKDYTARVVPDYASTHNLSVVCKHFFTRLSTFAGITYSYASGRPYNDMNSEEFMAGRTRSYNDISLNITYVTNLFRRDCIIHLNITNLPGFQNVFGYRYSGVPDENGIYASSPVVPTTGRQAVLLIMLSL